MSRAVIDARISGLATSLAIALDSSAVADTEVWINRKGGISVGSRPFWDRVVRFLHFGLDQPDDVETLHSTLKLVLRGRKGGGAETEGVAGYVPDHVAAASLERAEIRGNRATLGQLRDAREHVKNLTAERRQEWAVQLALQYAPERASAFEALARGIHIDPASLTLAQKDAYRQKLQAEVRANPDLSLRPPGDAQPLRETAAAVLRAVISAPPGSAEAARRKAKQPADRAAASGHALDRLRWAGGYLPREMAQEALKLAKLRADKPAPPGAFELAQNYAKALDAGQKQDLALHIARHYTEGAGFAEIARKVGFDPAPPANPEEDDLLLKRQDHYRDRLLEQVAMAPEVYLGTTGEGDGDDGPLRALANKTLQTVMTLSAAEIDSAREEAVRSTRQFGDLIHGMAAAASPARIKGILRALTELCAGAEEEGMAPGLARALPRLMMSLPPPEARKLRQAVMKPGSAGCQVRAEMQMPADAQRLSALELVVRHLAARGGGHTIETDYQKYLAEDARLNEIVAVLPPEDPDTAKLIERHRAITDKKNGGDFIVAAKDITGLINRGEGLRDNIQQRKGELAPELDRIKLPDWVETGKRKEMAAELDLACIALQPALPSAKQLDAVRTAIDRLDRMIKAAKEEATQKKREMLNQVDGLIKGYEVIATKGALPEFLIRARIALQDNRYPSPAQFEEASEAIKKFGGIVAQEKQTASQKKQDMLRQISELTVPDGAAFAAQRQLSSLLAKAKDALSDEYPSDRRFEVASTAISDFNCLAAREEERRQLREELAKISIPEWLDQHTRTVMDNERNLVGTMIDGDYLSSYPSPLDCINDLRQWIEAFVADHRTTLLNRLSGFDVPPVVHMNDRMSVEAARDKVTKALAAEYPTSADFRSAETAIKALEGLLEGRLEKLVRPVAGVWAKYGSAGEVAQAAREAFAKFHAILGEVEVEVDDKFIADARQTLKQCVRRLKKEQGRRDSLSRPRGTIPAIGAGFEGNDTLRVAKEKAEAYLKAAIGRKNLIDALAHGPLSLSSGQKLEDATAAFLIRAFTENPTLVDKP